MRVSIDAGRCQGHGRCYSLAPSLFEFDDLGSGVVLGDGTLSDETLELARLAQANCPERAILIED
ncbi:MAG: ferredoxin [Acidimicrobiales bacterium]